MNVCVVAVGWILRQCSSMVGPTVPVWLNILPSLEHSLCCFVSILVTTLGCAGNFGFLYCSFSLLAREDSSLEEQEAWDY